MTADTDTRNTNSTDKKRARWKYVAKIVLKAFLVLVLFFMGYFLWHAVPITMSFFNDYCYLQSLKITNEEIYEPRIQTEKSKKLPGWEERVKRMEERSAQPEPDETFFLSLLASFCGEPTAERKPSWVSEDVDETSRH